MDAIIALKDVQAENLIVVVFLSAICLAFWKAFA